MCCLWSLFAMEFEVYQGSPLCCKPCVFHPFHCVAHAMLPLNTLLILRIYLQNAIPYSGNSSFEAKPQSPGSSPEPRSPYECREEGTGKDPVRTELSSGLLIGTYLLNDRMTQNTVAWQGSQDSRFSDAILTHPATPEDFLP